MPGVVDSTGALKITTATEDHTHDGVTASQGGSSLLPLLGMVNGRLTLTSGDPVHLADQTAKTTVYFSPYMGNRISIYDGSADWPNYGFTEKSVAVPATTVKPFDVFGYISSGALALQTVNWTNDTTRATEIVTQDGVYVKNGAPAYRYLGTGRTTGVSGQIEDSAVKRFLWNYYNRKVAMLNYYDATGHTYTTATYRPWNNDATTAVRWVVGVQEVTMLAHVGAQINQQAGEGIGFVSLGFDTQSAASLHSPSYHETIGRASYLWTGGDFTMVIGYHYLQAIEYGAATSPDFNRVEILATLSA